MSKIYYKFEYDHHAENNETTYFKLTETDCDDVYKTSSLILTDKRIIIRDYPVNNINALELDMKINELCSYDDICEIYARNKEYLGYICTFKKETVDNKQQIKLFFEV